MTATRWPQALATAFCLSAMVAACGGGGASAAASTTVPVPVPVPSSEPADLVLRGGPIYLVDAANSVATAMAIRDGLVVHTGDNDSIDEFIGPNTERIDLDGRAVIPGIHDVHVHPLEAGSIVAGTCIVDPNADILSNEFQQTLSSCAPRQRGGIDWVLGFGHSIDQLLNLPAGVRPREILDDAIPNMPVAFIEETSHSVWANSAALELAGIDRFSEDPVGGVIARDRNGDPTGLLLDNAGDILYELAYLPPTDQLQQLHYEGLLWSLERLARNGITSIANARVYTRRGYLDVWRRAQGEGTLTARTVLGLWAYPTLEPGETDSDQIDRLLSLYDNDPQSMLRISQVKFYSDGIYSNETAAMLAPYPPEDRLSFLVSEDHRGLNYFTQERLEEYVEELERAGYDAHIHAIGDRGVRESLNALESVIATNGDGIDRRHRLTHVEEVNAADIPRFADLGVIADFQVAGDFTLPLPGEGLEGFIPVRDVWETGATVTLSSDWDVSSLSPFVGMQNALQRAEQSLPDLQSVLRAYTIDAAYALRSENRTGSLEVGKLADLVVIDQDIFSVPVDEIAQTRVVMTILEGETIYDGRLANMFGFATLPELGKTNNLGSGMGSPEHTQCIHAPMNPARPRETSLRSAPRPIRGT